MTLKPVVVAMQSGVQPKLDFRAGLMGSREVRSSSIEAHGLVQVPVVGDEILSVNEHDLSELTHDEAADSLQQAPRMILRIRRLGKVPCDPVQLADGNQDHDRTQRSVQDCRLVDNLGYGGARGDVVERLECGLADPTPSRVNRGSSRRPSPRHQTSEEIEEVLDAKCAQLLSTSARISLAYYRNEYETRAMTVDALVAVLLELLDTPHKYALLGHLRSSIRPEDLDKVFLGIYLAPDYLQKTCAQQGPGPALQWTADVKNNTGDTTELRFIVPAWLSTTVTSHHVPY
ncbi:hypothetical protein MRX96_059272 [Rhipicephalus microplus]